MSEVAQRTGTWPANQPFGFAEACTTSTEQSTGHKRHRMFRFQNANATGIPNPAALPNTPPLAADATHGGF
jgi:dihydroorotate dehydrogenase